MSRKKKFFKRKISPDIVYNSVNLSKFINLLMKKGKKATAANIVYKSLNIIKVRFNSNPLQILDKALYNIRPIVEVKSRRVGGATYQVPIEVKEDRAVSLSMRWLIEYSFKRGKKNMSEKLADEIIDASDDSNFTGNSVGKGGAIKKREEVHRMAEANKAFSHYIW